MSETQMPRLTGADVAEYLEHNPQFFEEHADLISRLVIPHPHGGRAISITERQMLALRDKNKALEGRMAELLGFGEANDAISEKMHRLAVALVAATTHYAELKVYAMTTPGVQNASCEFDVETLAPTYRLIIGIPGKSNAFAISRRLGLPEEIIQKAAERIDAENIRFEDVLTRLEEQRQSLERERAGAVALRQEMETAARKAARYQEEVAREREKATEAARAEATGLQDRIHGQG